MTTETGRTKHDENIWRKEPGMTISAIPMEIQFGIDLVDRLRVAFPEAIDEQQEAIPGADLISYLMHWVEARGGDPAAALRLAICYYNEERELV